MPHTVQHGFEAWCLGATDISDVDFKFDGKQPQQQSSTPTDKSSSDNSGGSGGKDSN